MRLKIVLKRISIFLLCFILLSFSVFFSYSRSVKAAVPVVAVGIAALASFLSAAGVSLTTQNMTKDSFTDSLYDMANQYSESSNVISIEDAMKSKDALNYYFNSKTGDAVVSMNETMVNWFDGFKTWFVQNFAFTDSGETVVFNDNFISGPNGEKYLYYPDHWAFVNGKVPSSIVPVVGSQTENITISTSNGNAHFRIIVGEPYEYYGQRISVEVQALNAQGTVIGSYSHAYGLNGHTDFTYIKVFFSQLNGSLWLSMAPSDAGDYTVWNYGVSTNISVNSLDLENIGLSGSLTEGYADFEQALNDAKTDAGANGQVAVDAGSVAVDKPYTDESIANGILDNAITNVGTGTLVGGYVDEKEVEQETDTEKVPTVAEIGEGIVLVDGLEDFFPFCIPFDLYAIINLLNVPAEAPKFDWKMSFAGRVDDYDISIDLTPYNTVAYVFRIMIIIVFLIFLTLKTRDLIRG